MKTTAIVAMACVAPVICADAQDIDGSTLQEVTVTAQRREQNLQEVPISVSVFSGEAIDRNNVKGAASYLEFTPNVSFTEDAQSGSRGLNIAIRGVNNLVSGENAFVNSVGVYLDEFSIASVPSGIANPSLVDMDRVEVLRGPQGTYFGRNSLGGALNLTTRAPSQKFEGQVSVGGEAYEGGGEMGNISGVLNVPVGDRFAMRGVVSYENSSGFVKNINPVGTDDSGHEWFNARLRGIFEPSERTRMAFTLIHANEDQGTDESVPSGVMDLDTVDTFAFQPGVAFDPGTGFWPHNQNRLNHNLPEENTMRTSVGIGSVAHEFSDSLTLKLVAGVIDTKQERYFDQDLIGLDLLARHNLYEGRSWSVESRLEGRSDVLDWVVGALYAEDRQEQYNNVTVSGDPTALMNGVGFLPPFPSGLSLYLQNKDFKVESKALFADVTWHLSKQLDLIVGARYTDDDVLNKRGTYGTAPSCNCGPSNPDFFPSFINVPRPESSGKVSFSDLSPRAGLRFAWSDTGSVYLTVSKGYKAGGTNTGNNTNAPGSPAFVVPYDKETLWNYEAGIKTELADRRIRLNISAFFLDWKDLQMEAFRFLTPGDLSSIFEQTVNIDAEAKGIEVEVLAVPTDRVTLGGSLGYLDSKITDEPVCGVPNGGPGGKATCIQITGGFNVSAIGLNIPKSPKLTANLFAEYRWPVAGNYAWLRGEFVHRSSQYSDIEALTNLQTRGPSPNQGLVRVVGADEFPYKVPSYDVVNLRAGYDWQRVALTFHVQNVTKEKYYTGTQENFGLSGIRLRPHPRTFGAAVTVRF